MGIWGVSFVEGWKEATVFVLCPFLLWGNAAASVMKYQLLFAL